MYIINHLSSDLHPIPPPEAAVSGYQAASSATMETSVMLPSLPIEFNFDSSCTSPYMSAPSSPSRFGTPFFSAPTSPSRISSDATIYTSLSTLPFNWDQKPHLPKSPQPNKNDQNDGNDEDFAFDFSGELDRHYLPADELFHGGKIKPFKPPVCLNSPKKTFKEAFNPRSTKRRDVDSLEVFKNTSMQESPMGNNFQQELGRKHTNIDHIPTPSSSRHHKTRSLSPSRVSDLLFDQETEPQQKTSNSSSSSSWYMKWKIKDLLLFRSASEGRQSSKAQANKYSVLKKQSKKTNRISQEDDDVKNLSFRSVDSSVGSSRRRSGLISAHELHYTINRAVSEEMKKKTFLPYKQGLLGCLGFQPANNDISRGVGLVSMSRGSF